jgi:hypothetical protein
MTITYIGNVCSFCNKVTCAGCDEIKGQPAPTGVTALFSMLARGESDKPRCACYLYEGDNPECAIHSKERCTFCGGTGDGSGMVEVNGYHVPASHTTCITEIRWDE